MHIIADYYNDDDDDGRQSEINYLDIKSLMLVELMI